MKAKELAPEFKPIKIELVIESEDELRDLYVRLNAPYQVLLYSKPSNTDSIAVKHIERCENELYQIILDHYEKLD